MVIIFFYNNLISHCYGKSNRVVDKLANIGFLGDSKTYQEGGGPLKI